MNLPSGPMAHTIRCTVFALCAAISGGVIAAIAEPMEIEADMLAEIARLKASSSTQARRAASAGTGSKRGEPPAAECGALAIGNVIGNNRIGISPVDINVVIVGDVINANNKCK